MQRASDDALLNQTLLAIAGLLTEPWDYVTTTFPTSSSEVYTYKTGTSGGSGGTTVFTITVLYTDSTKSVFLTAYKN